MERFFAHANKAFNEAELERVRQQQVQDRKNPPDELQLGGIMGSVTLVDCIKVDYLSQRRRLFGRLFDQQSPYRNQTNEIYYGFIQGGP